ncbi:MAG: hypothetical protein ACK5AB_05630 [Bacteroidota bacterium]|jgi:hypothetical protein
MIRAFIFICLIFFAQTEASAQELGVNLSLVKQIKGEFDLLDVDEGGNIYLLTAGGQLKKYNANFDSLSVFNEVRRYGKLYSIHSQNALRTYLYFKNFNVVLILDRMMQLVQRIDLRKANLFQVNSICPSYDNQLWIFDEQNSKIKKIRLDATIAFESTDLRLVFPEKLSPVKIIEHQGYLYLLDPQHGIYVFDYYGGFKERIAVPHIRELQTLGKELLYSTQPGIWKMWTEKNETIWRINSEQLSSAQQIYFSPKMAYITNRKELSIYTYQLNQ